MNPIERHLRRARWASGVRVSALRGLAAMGSMASPGVIGAGRDLGSPVGQPSVSVLRAATVRRLGTL